MTAAEKTKQWRKNHKGYERWRAMIRRCYQKDHHGYKHYGARGIKVCDRWLNSFADFLTDIGPQPSKNHMLDRIDNNGNYEPCNIRWATFSEQNNNRRNNIIIEYKGRKMSANQWSRETGLHVTRILYRFHKGYNENDVFSKDTVLQHGEVNGNCKLTESQIIEIRNKYIPNVYGMASLANEYSISTGHVWRIINNISWKHV